MVFVLDVKRRKHIIFAGFVFVAFYLIRFHHFQLGDDFQLSDGARSASAPAGVVVSIIILTYKKHDALSKLLSSVSLQTPPKSEIIVADNGCLPETEKLINAFRDEESSLHVGHFRLCDNPGYAAGNNAAAKLASPASKYLLFLNDDVVLSGPAFLQDMVDLAERQRNAAAVGCKLVNAGGIELIEAGSMVFKDGSAAGYGRGDPNPYADIYSYPKPVDYVSGACLLVEKDAFTGYLHDDGGGGFDGAVFPNYYEDTDLQLHIQHDLKREVWLQPKSVAFHEEHGSFGQSESVKLMQRAQGVFRNKWKHELNETHIDHGGMKYRHRVLLTGADLRARNPGVANILYLDLSAPKKTMERGPSGSFDNLSKISELGHRVTLVTKSHPAENDWCSDACVGEITGLGVEYVIDITLLHLLETRFGFYDYVVLSGADTDHDLEVLQELNYCPSAGAETHAPILDCQLTQFEHMKGRDPQRWLTNANSGQNVSCCKFG